MVVSKGDAIKCLEVCLIFGLMLPTAILFIWSPNIALKEVMSFSGHSSKYITSAKHTLGLHLSHVKCTVIFLLHSTTETNISNECNQCRLIHNSFCECVSGLQLSFCAIEENHSKNPQNIQTIDWTLTQPSHCLNHRVNCLSNSLALQCESQLNRSVRKIRVASRLNLYTKLHTMDNRQSTAANRIRTPLCRSYLLTLHTATMYYFSKKVSDEPSLNTSNAFILTEHLENNNIIPCVENRSIYYTYLL